MSYGRIEPTQKGSRLRRVTFWVTIIAVLTSLAFAYIAAIFGPTPYPYDPTGYLIYLLILPPGILVSPLYIAWIPFLIIHTRRLLGGIYLVVLSSFFISIILFNWAIYRDTDNWDKYGSWMVYFLPPWILCFVSGLLRIMVWCKEKPK